jgi:hypothetical protein
VALGGGSDRFCPRQSQEIGQVGHCGELTINSHGKRPSEICEDKCDGFQKVANRRTNVAVVLISSQTEVPGFFFLINTVEHDRDIESCKFDL